MPEPSSLLAFAAITLGMALTPGPNMVYLISRSICQERTAGLISLGAVALSFVFYMLCAAFGITAFVMVVPYAYAALRLGGAAYLLYLAWQAVRPGGRSPFQIRDLPDDNPRNVALHLRQRGQIVLARPQQLQALVAGAARHRCGQRPVQLQRVGIGLSGFQQAAGFGEETGGRIDLFGFGAQQGQMRIRRKSGRFALRQFAVGKGVVTAVDEQVQ